MNKLAATLSLAVVGTAISVGSASAALHDLSNAALTTSSYLTYFSNIFYQTQTGTFDFGGDGKIEGEVFSGIDRSITNTYGANNDQYLYAYFYSITNYATYADGSRNTHSVTGFSLDFGSSAPYAFDFGSGLQTSWWGSGTGWNPTLTDVNNAPKDVTYNDLSGVATFSFSGANYAINPGEQSSWMLLLSLAEPGLTTFNVINGGAGEIAGNVLAPVPEPATMLLFGTGIAGLAGMARRRMRKE